MLEDYVLILVSLQKLEKLKKFLKLVDQLLILLLIQNLKKLKKFPDVSGLAINSAFNKKNWKM